MERQKIEIGVKEFLNAGTFKKDGFVLEGWNTLPDGTGTHYEDGDEVLNLATNAGDVVNLYAEWGTAYTIEYYPNGGEGTMESQVVKYGERVSIKSNDFIKPGYAFVCWTTSPSSTNDSYGWTGWSGIWKYTNGKFGVVDRRLKLYAVWKRTAGYYIVYDANGGSGEMESQYVMPGEKVSIKSNVFTKDKYRFLYWTTNENGTNDGYGWTGWSGTWSYKDGQYGIKDGVLKLYAMWE